MAHDRHRLRIAVKQLRYMVELFGNLFDAGKSQRFLRRLKRLQDGLGYASNLRAAHHFVIELCAEIEPRSPALRAWIVLLEWHDRAFARTEQKLRRRLRQLNHAKPSWRPPSR